VHGEHRRRRASCTLDVWRRDLIRCGRRGRGHCARLSRRPRTTC